MLEPQVRMEFIDYLISHCLSRNVPDYLGQAVEVRECLQGYNYVTHGFLSGLSKAKSSTLTRLFLNH
jgi:hypothetical protein